MLRKKDLRKHYLQKRKEILSPDIDQQSTLLSELLFDIPIWDQPLRIHSFLPIQENHEVNTFIILNKIWENHPRCTTYVPTTHFEGKSMVNHFLDASTPLNYNRYNIPESTSSQTIPHGELDLVLIPLLIFDQRGFRLGYGGGFYDRMLAQCPESTIKIGLSLFPPVDLIPETDQYDIAMDYCITPEQVFKW